MNHVYHVLTPLRRFENLEKLIKMLEGQRQTADVQWYPIIDDDSPFYIFFRQPWIHLSIQHNSQGVFWARCNSAINQWLDTHPLKDDERYCIMNDDDSYEDGFFEKLDKVEGGLVIASMKRGNQTPAGVDPVRAHGVGTLVAAPEFMKAGQVGVEQFFICGRWLRDARLPIASAGDGIMVEWLVNTHGAAYAPDAFVHFNFHEPGRWT